MTLIALLLASSLHAAIPPSNAITICTEVQACVVTNVTAGGVLWFGAGANQNIVPTPYLYPMTITCNVACPQLGGDPAVKATKTLVAIPQMATFTVIYTLAGKTKSIIVPGTSGTTYIVTCQGLGTTDASGNMTITGATCSAVQQ